MSQEVLQYYLGMAKEPFRSLQQKGTRIFPDQNEDELVVAVFQNNWTAYLSRYGIAVAAWLVSLITTLIVLSISVTPTTALATMLIALMITGGIDATVMLGIANRHLDALILTSRRLIWRKFRGLLSDRSDIISFDNLNDTIHTSQGVFSSKIAKEGTIILKLASGEERRLARIPDSLQAVNLISRVQDLYKTHGQLVSFASLFTKPAAPKVASMKESLTTLEEADENETHSSFNHTT